MKEVLVLSNDLPKNVHTNLLIIYFGSIRVGQPFEVRSKEFFEKTGIKITQNGFLFKSREHYTLALIKYA